VRIEDRGSGTPIVFIPGLQGRWEYMRRAIGALAESNRVITFSLADEPSAAFPFDRSNGFDSYVRQVEAALDRCGVTRAAICGVSFGGLIALRFAARHPERTAALILVSSPGPGWHLKPLHERYSRHPWLYAPLFFAGMPQRLRAEFGAAFPNLGDRLRFQCEQVATFLRAPLLPSRMGYRARLIAHVDIVDEAGKVAAPTLVVTGEPGLDHVVHGDTASHYPALISGARVARLPRTGHLGCLTRPREFARMVDTFLREQRHAAA
jgi:pimeloyl-ACP methyl ester carboxylesterase